MKESEEIVPANTYRRSLMERFMGLDIPAYKLKTWFSTKHQIFFDCENKAPTSCIDTIRKQKDFPAFTIFFIVKQPNGAFKFMDASFKNIGNTTLERFIKRFHQQLEPMTRLSVQSAGFEYVEYVGHSYQ